MRPTPKELQEKKWYRLWQVLTWIIVILAFIGPWMIHKPNPWLIMDGLVSSIVWLILLFASREIILYVLYGSKQVNDIEKKEKKLKYIFSWIWWLILFGITLIIMFFLIKLLSSSL
jgi:Mn2+/Fe2+ NRAMP family transporter